MRPIHGEPAVTEGAVGASWRIRASTIGLAGVRRRASSSAVSSASRPGSGVITASGFSSRSFRARSRATAASFAASQARW